MRSQKVITEYNKSNGRYLVYFSLATLLAGLTLVIYLAVKIDRAQAKMAAGGDEKSKEASFTVKEGQRLLPGSISTEPALNYDDRLFILNELIAKQLGPVLAHRYSAMFSKMGLAGDSRDRLLSVLALRSIGSTLEGQSLSRSSTPEDIDRFWENIKLQVYDIVGQEKFLFFEENEKQLASNNLIEHMQNLLRIEGDALTPQQVSSFRNLVEGSRMENGTDLLPLDKKAAAMGSAEYVLSDVIVARAGGFLSAVQLGELRKIFEIQKAKRDVDRVYEVALGDLKKK